MKSLKVALILVFILSVFIFIACNDDENKPSVTSPGDTAWAMDNGMAITGQPVANDAMVIVEQGTVLHAVDAKSGKTIWQFQGLKFDNVTPIVSFRTPLLNDGVVYWAMNWGNVYALDIETGEQIWEYEVPIDYTETGMYHESFMVPPVYLNGMLYVVGYSGKLMAIDVSNGQLVWETKEVCSPKTNLVVSNDKIIVAGKCGQYRVVAFEAATGKMAWKYETPNQLGMYLHGDNDFVYAKDGANVIGLDSSTGAVDYELNTGTTEGRLQLVSSKFFFLAKDDRLYAFDKQSKQQHWTYPVKRYVAYKPTLRNNLLFVGDTEYLRVLGSDTGSLMWEIQLHTYSSKPGGVVELVEQAFTPTLNDEYVYVALKDKLFAIKR